MCTEVITIRVDADSAKAYREASEQKRKKLDLLLSIHLQEALRASQTPTDLMKELSRKAQERGLTPEILEAILQDPT